MLSAYIYIFFLDWSFDHYVVSFFVSFLFFFLIQNEYMLIVSKFKHFIEKYKVQFIKAVLSFFSITHLSFKFR